MKKICLLTLSVLCLYSCIWPVEKYYEPVFNETEEIPEKLSCLGEVCYFDAMFECVMTKWEFNSTMYSKPFKYVIEIEGIEPSEPKIIKDYNELNEEYIKLRDRYSSFCQEWPKLNGTYKLAFHVPINLSEAERKVEVKLCVADEYDSIADWGEWETVFSAVQEAFTLPEQKIEGKITLDHEYFAVGQDSTAVYELLATDPLFRDRTYCKFVESTPGRFKLELYDNEGALVDKGSIDNLGNTCEFFPEVFESMLPEKEIVGSFEWKVDFTQNGSRQFYVVIVYSDKHFGIFGKPYEIYLYEDLSSEYAVDYNIEVAVKKHRMHFLTPLEIEEVETIERDVILLDGYTVLFGEYIVTGIPGYDEMIPEDWMETAENQIEEKRLLQDHTRLTLNKDRTYSMTEYEEIISSGTYEIGMYEWETSETMCYYYPGPCSKLGYLTLKDRNGSIMGFEMQISAHTDESKEYGIPWLYQYIDIIDGNTFYHGGIRYGLTLQE